MTVGLGGGVPRPENEIEVRSRFDGRWVGGFEIAATDDDRFLLRRRSDGAVLPVPFPADDIRPRKSPAGPRSTAA
jgi:hypothetical protein